MSKCKDCIYFKRIKFHKSIDKNEAEQKGGNCAALKDALLISNSHLWATDFLHVYESFGCVLFLEESNSD